MKPRPNTPDLNRVEPEKKLIWMEPQENAERLVLGHKDSL
jgi:hypothetical protein